MTEVDYGGGGAPHTAKRSMINLCVYGVPPPPYIKEWRRREGRPSMARPGGVLLPSLAGLGETEEGEREGGDGGHNVYLGSGPLDGGNTLLPA